MRFLGRTITQSLLISVKTSIQLCMREEDISEIIHLAWCDKTSFDEIELQFGLKESEVKVLMRTHLKRSSFKMWRRRVYGRRAKHSKRLRPVTHQITLSNPSEKE